MELEDWEYLSGNNLFNSHTIEESSSLAHEQDQHHALEKDQGDVLVKEIREITEECDAVPQTHFETLDETEESREVEFDEKDVLKEESSEVEMSRSFEFVEEEVEEVKEVADMVPKGNDCVKGSNKKILRWSLRGIGALSSVGIAAATLSMLTLGGCKRSQNRKFEIQIHADDERMKQVMQHATKLNQALLGGREVPGATAKIFAGYYQGL